MGRGTRKKILIALGLVTLIGVSFHFLIWSIDYGNTSNDIEAVRKEFDLANREAMDESAEWRRRYDFESEKSAKCLRELDELKKSGGATAALSRRQKKSMEMLEKENIHLVNRVESLKQELEAAELKCRN